MRGRPRRRRGSPSVDGNGKTWGEEGDDSRPSSLDLQVLFLYSRTEMGRGPEVKMGEGPHRPETPQKGVSPSSLYNGSSVTVGGETLKFHLGAPTLMSSFLSLTPPKPERQIHLRSCPRHPTGSVFRFRELDVTWNLGGVSIRICVLERRRKGRLGFLNQKNGGETSLRR